MEQLGGFGGSFEESLASKQIPSQAAADLIALPVSTYPVTDPTVQEFLVQSISEILDDQSVQSDLSRRISSVTGGSVPAAHSHAPGERCAMVHMSRADLLELAPVAVEQSAQTFSNVLSRGQKDSTPMDSSTAGFLRRRIWTESIIREIVKREHKSHLKKQEEQSKQGVFFAFPNPETIDMDQLHVFSNSNMHELMDRGYTVLVDFFGKKSMYKELVRLDALALLRPTADPDQFVYWTDLGGLVSSGLTHQLCQKLSLIPFELNLKNRNLLLQIVQQIQVSKIFGRVDLSNKTQKIACIYTVSESSEQKIKITTNDASESVKVASGDLLVFNLAKVISYEGENRRFQVSVFLTGPN